MEVADHHNFSVNGGLIIHNCIDALRYGCSLEMYYYKEQQAEKRKAKDYNYKEIEDEPSWLAY